MTLLSFDNVIKIRGTRLIMDRRWKKKMWNWLEYWILHERYHLFNLFYLVIILINPLFLLLDNIIYYRKDIKVFNEIGKRYNKANQICS